MQTSLFAFAYDIVEEGVATVLDRVARAGVEAVLLAVTYHEGRDVFPHARRRRVRYLEPGVTFFSPDPARYRGLAIQPRPSALIADGDPLAELVTASARRGRPVRAWTIFLHHDRVGEHEAFAPRNAFGDPVATDLCPSHEPVRAYARALAADVASRGVETILAEAVHFLPLEHGLHHERYFIPLGPRTRFLLGLCFCDGCRAAARRAGVDGDALQRWTVGQLEAAFERDVDDPPRELQPDEIASLADGELWAYLRVRMETVTKFVRELHEVTRTANVRLAVLEPGGGVKGYADGRPTGDPASSVGWRFGLDLAAVAAACDEIEAMGYAAAVERVAEDIDAYREALGGASLALALRPTRPDSDSVANLAAKVRLAVSRGVRRLDFYHYGLMRLDALDRIAAALVAVRADQRRRRER